MNDFARGARIKQKPRAVPEVSIDQEIPFPQFIVMMGIYTVRDYKIRDKATFMNFCAGAFDAAIKTHPEGR